MHFHKFILFRFLCNKWCSKVIFRIPDEKPTHKHVLRRQMTEIGNPFRDLWWPWPQYRSHRATEQGLDMSQTRILSIHSLIMRLLSAFFGENPINGNVTFCVWPDLWRHRWHRGQLFSTSSERSRPGLSIAVWIFPSLLLVTEIDGGALRPASRRQGSD